MTSVLSRIEPLPTDDTEPVTGYTRQQLEDMQNDWLRRGYRLGRLHEAEDGAARLAQLPDAGI